MHLRACADAVNVGSTHEALVLKARSGFGAAYHALAQVRPRQFFYWGGGGGRAINRQTAIFVAASRGNEKSNTVTALWACLV